ncbi:MAG TPA: ABC transporter permease [Puia sp.]|nr:ABC transporter permease [Puia sp.]
MIKNYFKTAWRNLVHNKVYSALNILGLAIGMTVSLLIGLWVYYQYSYDRFLPEYQQAYQVWIRTTTNGGIGAQPYTPLPLAAAIKNDVPGVKYIAQTDWFIPRSLVVGDKKVYLHGGSAGEDFFNIFQFPFIKGNASSVLKDPSSIVLTQSTAKALFGDEDPVGRTIRIDNDYNAKVTGVLKDLPGNSSFQFGFIIPFNYSLQNYDWVSRNITNWRNSSWQTFVALQPGVSYAQVAPALGRLLEKYNPTDYKLYQSKAFLHPLRDWHLYSDFRNGVAAGGFIDYVKMFSIIGFLVLCIACINFMNLSTARSERRAREVGVRKAIGSQRKDLIFQFLVESLAITFIAFIFSLVFTVSALPAFNALTNTTVVIPWTNVVFWIVMISYVLLTGLLAGSRPAFYLSSFHPVKVLKGTIHSGRSATLSRKALVVLQFSCSIALIISTIIIYQQIQHAKDRPLGYDADRLMMTDASGDLKKNYNAFRDELLSSGLVSSVTKSSSPATEIWASQRIDDWQGKQAGESLDLATVAVSDADYFKTMGMQLKMGSNWRGNLAADSLNVILNEAAVARMRYKEPLNQVITWHDVPQRVKVIGVVKNSLMASPFSQAAPTIFIYDPGWGNIVTYRLAPRVNTKTAISRMAPIFGKYNPSYPYLYKFVDESYASKFSLENLIGKLAGLFATLAIVISCLGLFGLAAYMAEQRTKEIGIRKVLGASVSQVWFLLSKDFVVLVLISCVIASPIALYFLQDWLLKYEYRIRIGPLVFIVAALAAVVITLLTISWQAIKAAVANPVKSLKME